MILVVLLKPIQIYNKSIPKLFYFNIIFFAETGKGVLDEGNFDHDDDSSETDQMGAGSVPIQSSSQAFISNEDAFVEKIALLVSKKIEPRLSNTSWNNFNLSSPNSATITESKLDGPVHYDNTITKNQENDQFGLCYLITILLIAYFVRYALHLKVTLHAT